MRILIIEDDRELCDAVRYQLTNSGYYVDALYSGADAFDVIKKTPYDIVILDRLLPEQNGLSILQGMRNRHITTPVIMVTAMDSVQDRIDGLDCGADDYLVKPFAMDELLARVRALARRPRRMEQTALLEFSDLKLDTGLFKLESEKGFCILSRRESELMEYFLRNAGQTLSRERILSHVWGPDYFVENGNLDNYIYFLRRRLKSLGTHTQIKTVYSVGYRLEEKK